MRKSRHDHREHADLDITGLLNIMIVLVPVLLMSLVFAQITVLNLKLPEGGAGGPAALANEEIELVIRADQMVVNFPRGTVLKAIPNTPEQAPDFALLSLVMQDLKKLLNEKAVDKKSITILSEPETPYQTLISAVDTVRSYKTVVAASAVDAELFPEVAFGDAPVSDEQRVDEPGVDEPASTGAGSDATQ
jgi:biopolymer transport protein ExbD